MRGMQIDEISQVLSAVGQPTRLEILKCVAPFSKGERARGVAAGEIARTLELAPATLSFHLKDMTYKGLLLSQRDGRVVRYRADLTLLLETLDHLVTDVCQT